MSKLFEIVAVGMLSGMWFSLMQIVWQLIDIKNILKSKED